MISVIVSGAKGRMGTCISETLSSIADIDLVGLYDPAFAGQTVTIGERSWKVSADLAALIAQTGPDVMIDFSTPSVVLDNIGCALRAGVSCVAGTTGVSLQDLKSCAEESSSGEAKLFYASNFTTGAVLMMQFAKLAARFFPDIEIIEMHHDGKKDAPSGTALTTAHMIGEAREGRCNIGPGSETEIPACRGARGCEVDGVRIHSIRADGYMASQEVLLSSCGQVLTIRHDSSLRSAYMDGILMAVRAVRDLPDVFTSGLETLLDL